MAKHTSTEHPAHSDEYKNEHPHIHEVKYKDAKGRVRIYIYRYGTVKKTKSQLQKVQSR